MNAFQILAGLVSLALIGFAIVVIERAQALVRTERATRASRTARRYAPPAGGSGARVRLRD